MSNVLHGVTVRSSVSLAIASALGVLLFAGVFVPSAHAELRLGVCIGGPASTSTGIGFNRFRCADEQGPAGPQGPQGETGATGPEGPQGDIGPIGPQGPEGDVGPAGPTGLAGEPGSDGEDGTDGVDGATGPAGADGVDGAQGPQGDIGPQGPQGDEGPQGDPGVDGADGATGPEGPAGADGADGANGTDGTDGADGAAGAPGADGRSALTPLEAGEAIHGGIGLDVHAGPLPPGSETGQDFGTIMTLPIPANKPLTDDDVVAAGPSSEESPADLALCPGLGSSTAGVLCIYYSEASSDNIALVNGYSIVPGAGGSPYGFKLAWSAPIENADTFIDAVWEYIAD